CCESAPVAAPTPCGRHKHSNNVTYDRQTVPVRYSGPAAGACGGRRQERCRASSHRLRPHLPAAIPLQFCPAKVRHYHHVSCSWSLVSTLVVYSFLNHDTVTMTTR